MPASSNASARRAAANRSNARKSTGPRTPEGKARAALNALKHGCSARTPRLPGEDAAEIAAFVGEIVDDLAPATAMERELAERVAGLSWRRRRLHLAERELFIAAATDEDYLDRPRDARRGQRKRDPDGAGANGAGGKDDGTDARDPGEDDDESPLIESGMTLASQFDGTGVPALLRLADQQRRLAGSIDAALRMLIKLQDRRAKREREAAEATEADGGERDELWDAWVARCAADGRDPRAYEVNDGDAPAVSDVDDGDDVSFVPAPNEPTRPSRDRAALAATPAQNEPIAADAGRGPRAEPAAPARREPDEPDARPADVGGGRIAPAVPAESEPGRSDEAIEDPAAQNEPIEAGSIGDDAVREMWSLVTGTHGWDDADADEDPDADVEEDEDDADERRTPARGTNPPRAGRPAGDPLSRPACGPRRGADTPRSDA